MKTDDLRKKYLDFFRSKEHKVFSSDSLVPADDPSLLFTGAGMNQFKPYFLGLKKDVKRATSCQKCLRTADLDRVGKTAYHHSFFEMLGNFSFGDYFKEEAIGWGWEFVTKELRLPKEKLWVSVYQEDDEAFGIWKSKMNLPESRIVRMGPEDNFWPANAPKDGPNGPCGPCSEIYVGETPGKGVEIWNLVFTQFDRQSDGSLKPLPQKNIDTGMGLERTAAVLQGVASNFDTDNFQKIRTELKRLLKTGSNEKAHENAVMDHIRAIVFSIADGVLPSNEGRGYVIRKIIRLASDHFQRAGAINPGSLHTLIPVVTAIYGNTYPNLLSSQKTIEAIVMGEEGNYLFLRTGMLPKLRQSLLECKEKNSEKQFDIILASIAFLYYDTHGLPFELIQETAAEVGVNLNAESFNRFLEEQRERSRQSSKITGEIFSKKGSYHLIDGLPSTIFLGYEKTKDQGRLLKIITQDIVVDTLKAGEEGLLIFDRTPFYAESGGQIGDTGLVSGNGLSAKVLDTQWIEKCVAHRVKIESGYAEPGKVYELVVDAERRADIMKNHTATHLLHSALRKALGDHVKQSGSLVAPDRLRFDFTHFSALDAKTISAVEELVNTEIRKNITLDKKVMSKEKAVESGAIAFFGEKYGDEVRVVSVGDFSKELCGGTHLHSTGEIETFKIVSESSIQAGVRRIEAVTGRGAKVLLQSQENELKSMTKDFGIRSDDMISSLKERLLQISELKSKMSKSLNRKVRERLDKDLEKAPVVAGAKFVKEKISGADTDTLKFACDYLRSSKISFTALFVSDSADKISLVVAGSDDLVKKGFNSGKIVKEISATVQGNGGGRPDFAVGGGKDVQKVNEAIALGEKIIKESLAK